MRSARTIGVLWGMSVVTLSFVARVSADLPERKTDLAALAEATGTQQLLELPVRVVGADGDPVPNAKVTPWALRSSQGHGEWRQDDKWAKVGPQAVVTDADGTAAVPYPYYRDVEERVRTISVSLNVDHPEFAFISSLHIDVPLEAKEPHEIKLTRGVPLEVRPLLSDRASSLDQIFAMWSDGRSWQPGAAPEKLPDGVLRIPAMPPGENSVLLVKLDGERATHFSRIIDVTLSPGERRRLDVILRPSLRIEGVLSENVPRPVRGGRVKVWTLPPDANHNRVEWFTWAAVQPDGRFVIDGWPADEPLQLIALCEGYIAESGAAPEVVENPRDPDNDPFQRPQVFGRDADGPIKVEMTPLVRCVATAVDDDGAPIAGVTVASWPNVGWWNIGSQIYGHPLVHSERRVRERNYQAAVDDTFPQPFQAVTDAAGKATLELPVGKEDLAVDSDVYELPAFLGHRWVKVTLKPNETTEVTLRLQPRGSEKLGDWDKLAGVVFGCSTREGRRICALPGVQQKVEEITKRFRDAKDPRDPKLLSEAYSLVADAFTGVGDFTEAAKWRKKAAEQAAKVRAAADEEGERGR